MPVSSSPYLRRSGTHLAFWVPAAFLLTSTLIIWFLWRNAENMETRALQIETSVTAEQVKLRLESWIDSRIAMVTLLSRRWDLDPAQAPARFISQADAITQAFPGFQAVNFIDQDYVIRIIYPPAGNQAALGKDLHHHPDSAVPEALDRARSRKTLTRTHIIDLLQGKPGFATYSPIIDPDGNILGYVNGVFSIDKLVTGCLHEESLGKRFDIGLYAEDGTIAYRSGAPPSSPWPPAVTREFPVNIVQGHWMLRLAPSASRLRHRTLGPDQFLAIGGILLSIMLALLLRAYLLGVGALRDSREGYRILVDNIEDMVVKVSPDGTMVFSSPSFLAFLNKMNPEILGRKLSSFALEEKDRQTIAHAHQRILTGSQSEHFEIRMAAPTGPRWTQWTSTPLHNGKQKSEGIVSVGRDIQDKRQLEDQLRRSQKLQAIGQLAGGIAHDFNNILQAIQGYLEFALEDLPADSSV